MKQVHLQVTLKLVLNVEPGVDVNDVMQNINYEFTTIGTHVDTDAEVVETEIVEFEVTKEE